MSAETWRPAFGFEGVYEISDLGRVRRIKPGMGAKVGRILSTHLNKDGYEEVRLSNREATRTVGIHRLVAAAFIGEPEGGMEACHIDGSRANNVPSNLRWGTHGDNVRDTIKHGTHNQASKTHCKAGHEYSPANTRRYNGARQCRTCSRAASARYKASKRAVAS